MAQYPPFMQNFIEKSGNLMEYFSNNGCGKPKRGNRLHVENGTRGLIYSAKYKGQYVEIYGPNATRFPYEYD